jgi:hypothetical protein
MLHSRDALRNAIAEYDFPAIAYDFAIDQERRFSSMHDLEDFLQCLLRSQELCHVKNGLSGVLYWGHYRAGFRNHRVKRFRDTVTEENLRRAVGVFAHLQGTALMRLKRLKLPEFSNMAFLTKLRTFLDPNHYCVLDKKIAGLMPLCVQLQLRPTYIPVTVQNERTYEWLVDRCAAIASRLDEALRPVDVERGMFHLIDHGSARVAERLLQGA